VVFDDASQMATSDTGLFGLKTFSPDSNSRSLKHQRNWVMEAPECSGATICPRQGFDMARLASRRRAVFSESCRICIILW